MYVVKQISEYKAWLMWIGLKILIKINKPTAAQCSTTDSSWISNQRQIVNREIAKREKRKNFPKKETIVNEASWLIYPGSC